MSIVAWLCCFTVRQFGVEGTEALVRILKDQFTDRGQRLNQVLLESNRKAWRSLEIALAGESLWSRLDRAEDRALREQVRQFLKEIPLPELQNRQEVQKHCLTELRQARNKGLLFGKIVPGELADRAGKLAHLSEPQALTQAERQALYELASEIDRAGFRHLAWLLNQPAQVSQSIVVVASRFFFRRAVERDPQLFRGLQMTAVENLAAAQESSFSQLQTFLEAHEDRLEEALADATRQVIASVEAAQASIEARVGAVDEKVVVLQQMQAQMLALLHKLDLHNQPLHPRHTQSLSNERDRQQLRVIEDAYARLDEGERNRHPELLSSLGKLQVAAGDFRHARESFERVSTLVSSPRERAEAHHGTYRAALEQGDFDAALRELLQASAIDPGRFALFPTDKYEPLGILGVGGFGVTLLCQHKISRGKVAVKSLLVEDLDRDATIVLQEAMALDQLRHRGIVSLRDCGYADAEQRRPYLVMEYFPGKTLEEHVKQNGPLPVADARVIGVAIAEALQAAHGKGILHRDIKPANVLIAREGAGWDVRVIDFGLALRHDVLVAQTTARQSKTIMGSSIAGTLGYAAPEQMGRLPGVRVGPPADIYGFGRTFSYMVFGVTEPALQHYRKLPEDLADCLGHCLSHDPRERPQRFDDVLTVLRRRNSAPLMQVAEVVPVASAVVLEAEEVEPVSRSRRRQPKLTEEEIPERFGRRYGSDRDRDDSTKTDFATRMGHAALAFLLGWVGAHKFAQGNTGAGIVRVLITCTCIGLWVTSVIGVIESVMYLIMSDDQYHSHYIIDRKAWF